jgi:hypothetical protein
MHRIRGNNRVQLTMMLLGEIVFGVSVGFVFYAYQWFVRNSMAVCPCSEQSSELSSVIPRGLRGELHSRRERMGPQPITHDRERLVS